MTSNARTKKRNRERADRERIGYCSADTGGLGLSPGSMGPARGPLPHSDLIAPVGPDQLLRDSVEGWCESNLYSPVEDLSLDVIDQLELPPELEEPTVHELEPDLDTVDTQVVDEYDGGTVALNGTARASLRVEGIMVRAEAYAADAGGQVRILGERNERYLEVLLSAAADLEIEFTAVADLSAERVEDFDASTRFLGTT